MSRKNLFIFILIIIAATFLRFYRIIEVPPGVNQDEASIGYTAYSLLHTGKDEYGKFFPLSFESFGDWKLPFYIYITLPMVYFFGLTEQAVRTPSAIFGILSVVGTFFLVQLLFKNKVLSLISMFLVAISPWSLHLSRVESESNTAVFMIILGTIFFLKSFRTKGWIILSSILFALTYFIYAGNHIFTTLFVLGLIFIYRAQLSKTRLNIIALVIFLCFSGLIFYSTLFGADATKLAGIGIFGDPSIVHSKIEIPRTEHPKPDYLFTKIVHNRVVFAAERFFQNYLNAFSPQFLFIKGGENRAHNILNFGNMYLVEAPFLFLGLVYLLFFKKGKDRNLLLLWFFIAPIAASITKDAPHTNRMFAIVPVLQIVTGLGIYWFLNDLLKQKILKSAAFIIMCLLFVLNFSIYMDRYYVHFPKHEAQSWGIGYEALNKLLSQPAFAEKKVIMARPEYSPYIHLLFYSRYDPDLYQKQAMRYPPTADKFVHVKEFGRYEFREINWQKDINSRAILVDWTSRVPESVKKDMEITEITLPNGESMFTVVETR